MKFKKSILALALSFITAASFFGLQVPELTGPVIDKAKLLSSTEFTALDSELRALSSETGTQIVVLTIPSLEGVDIESFTMKAAEKWKIGSKEKDDGVILCIALAEKKIRIEVGYGLEGSLTDAKCGLIIRNVIAPEFQRGNYGNGVIKAVDAIEGIIGVGGNETSGAVAETDSDSTAVPVVLFFMAFYFFLITGALSTKFPGLRWLPWAVLFGRPSRHYHSNHHNDFFGGGGFSGGSFGGGGGFGGGFSGGGGGFGGGGASGGW